MASVTHFVVVCFLASLLCLYYMLPVHFYFDVYNDIFNIFYYFCYDVFNFVIERNCDGD